jgi:putative CRISPR-associated protein (TIGR02619 family)
MRNLLFVTVGVSALDAPRRIRGAAPTRAADLKALSQSVQDFKGDGTGAKAAKGSALFDPLLALHLEFWGQATVALGEADPERRTAAELLTTAVLLRQLADKASLTMDRVILLVPETPEAELAGRVVKTVMESNQYKGHCHVPEIRVRPIPGVADDEAARRLPDAVLCAVEENRDSETDRIIFNATAGFSATLILVGMLALRYGFRVYCQHDSRSSPMYISQNLNIGWSPTIWTLS